MYNKFELIRETPRLNCYWLPTGDAKKPLVCVWAHSKAAQPFFAAPSKDEPLGVRQCA